MNFITDLTEGPPVISLKGGLVAECSNAAVQLFELPARQRMLNQPIGDFFPSLTDLNNSGKEAWEIHISESHNLGIKSFPWIFESAKGRLIQVHITMVASDNRITLFLDATKESHETNKQESHLVKINQKIEEGIYRSSMDKGFYYGNRAFVKMFGFDSEKEVLDVNPDDIKSLYEITNDFMELVDQVKSLGFIRNQEVLFKRKDGSRFWGLHSCYLHPDDNGTQYLDGIIVDITPLKESQNLLKERNRELQKVKEEMDRFVYSVSHDLRAPLSSLLGLLNLAEVETNATQVASFIQMMKQSVKKLDHFINEILDYTRNARLKLEDDKIDLEKLLNKIITSIEYMDGFSSISKRVNVQSGCEFISDQKRVNIILNNLITNAVLYHDHNKEEPFIEVNAYIDRESVRIAVIDNGKGIPTTHLDKIFKMFYRASEDSKGSGLGLFMVKECVEKLHGTINVSSTFGIGTKFEIVLKNFNKSEESTIGLIGEREELT